jgi:hypothetical protein
VFKVLQVLELHVHQELGLTLKVYRHKHNVTNALKVKFATAYHLLQKHLC